MSVCFKKGVAITSCHFLVYFSVNVFQDKTKGWSLVTDYELFQVLQLKNQAF